MQLHGAFFALTALACGGRAGSDVRAETSAAVSLSARAASLVLTLPAGIPALSVSLAATEGVELETHAEAGAVTPPGLVTNVGTGSVVLGAHAVGARSSRRG